MNWRFWKRTPKPEPEPEQPAAYVVAVDSFAINNIVVRVGQRFLADDPVVLQAPGLFVNADLSDAEYQAARRAIYDR